MDLRPRREFAVELAEQRPLRCEVHLGAHRGQPELCDTGAPLTTKLAPGSNWNTALSAGSFTHSCAQATRARSCTGIAAAGRQRIQAAVEEDVGRRITQARGKGRRQIG